MSLYAAAQLQNKYNLVENQFFRLIGFHNKFFWMQLLRLHLTACLTLCYKPIFCANCAVCWFMPVIETLLCYLELHSKKWIENLQPIFANCSIQFYGGRSQMLAVAKKVGCGFLLLAQKHGSAVLTKN